MLCSIRQNKRRQPPEKQATLHLEAGPATPVQACPCRAAVRQIRLFGSTDRCCLLEMVPQRGMPEMLEIPGMPEMVEVPPEILEVPEMLEIAETLKTRETQVIPKIRTVPGILAKPEVPVLPRMSQMPEAPAPGKTVQIKARRQKQATGSPRRRPLRHCLQAPDSGKQTYEQSVTNRRYSKLYAKRRTSKHTVHKPKLPILTCKLEWKQHYVIAKPNKQQAKSRDQNSHGFLFVRPAWAIAIG